MRYIIYNEEGRINKNITSPSDMVEVQLAEGESYLESPEVVDDELFYVSNQSIIERPSFSESIVGTVISNLPIPTTIKVEGRTYEVLDGVAELSFSMPGAYRVSLYSFPYKDKTIEVVQQ